MNDSLASSRACWLPEESIAALGHDGDVLELMGLLEGLEYREHGLGLRLVALERSDLQRESSRVSEQLEGDLRFDSVLAFEGILSTARFRRHSTTELLPLRAS